MAGKQGSLTSPAMVEEFALTRSHVDREVAKAREMMKLGRYIPGFDHLIPPDASWDNFQYAANQIKAACYHEQ